MKSDSITTSRTWMGLYTEPLTVNGHKEQCTRYEHLFTDSRGSSAKAYINESMQSTRWYGVKSPKGEREASGWWWCQTARHAVPPDSSMQLHAPTNSHCASPVDHIVASLNIFLNTLVANFRWIDPEWWPTKESYVHDVYEIYRAPTNIYLDSTALIPSPRTAFEFIYMFSQVQCYFRGEEIND